MSLKECCHWQCQGVYKRNIYLAVSQPVRCCTVRYGFTETNRNREVAPTLSQALGEEDFESDQAEKRHGVGGHSCRKTTKKMCCSLLRPLMHDQSHQHLQYLLHLRHWGLRITRMDQGKNGCLSWMLTGVNSRKGVAV